jgi:hypothetical protein
MSCVVLESDPAHPVQVPRIIPEACAKVHAEKCGHETVFLLERAGTAGTAMVQAQNYINAAGNVLNEPAET